MIWSPGDGAAHDLLAILRLARLHVAFQGHDESAGHGCCYARLRYHDEAALGATARVASEADATGVHLWPRSQVVHGAAGIPNELPGQAGAAQDILQAGVAVLSGAATNDTAAGLGIEVLETLSLAGRVHGQHHEAVLGQVHAHCLVHGVGFARLSMAADEEHSRRRSAQLFRQVQVGGDVELGQALVDDLLDGIAAPVYGAGALGIQGRVLLEQAADGVQEALAHALAVCLEGGHTGDGPALDLLAAEVCLRPPAQIMRHLVGDVVVTVDVRGKCAHS